MKNIFSIGLKLRSLREERGLSQRQLAKAAGVSANAISLIERDENSPSVATLQSLAMALNVKMGYFFDDEMDYSVLHIKAQERPSLTSKGVRIEGLGENLSGQEIEPFLVSLEPHSGSGERQVVHTGHELVYCIKGVVEYAIDGETYLVQAGDFLVFEANKPHFWQNPGEVEASFLLVLQTPGSSHEVVSRHFSNYPSAAHIG